jgi:hypothetical protein
LRARSYKNGDVVAVNITKLRSPAFNRLAHKIGQLVAASIDDFQGMDAHQVLKRLQLEADAACEDVALRIKPSFWWTISEYLKSPAIKVVFNMFVKALGLDVRESGMVIVRIPKSLSFESLDEGEFNAAIKKICNHIVDQYWQTETPETIERMAMQYMEAA